MYMYLKKQRFLSLKCEIYLFGINNHISKMALAKTEKKTKNPPKIEQLTKSVQSCLFTCIQPLSRIMLDITYTFDNHLFTGLRPFLYRCDDIIYHRLDPELRLH